MVGMPIVTDAPGCAHLARWVPRNFFIVPVCSTGRGRSWFHVRVYISLGDEGPENETQIIIITQIITYMICVAG
jgi:hypothetical protein